MTPETPSNHPGADDSLIPPSFVPGARRQRPAPRQDPPQAAAPAPRRTSAHQAGASQAPPPASAGRSGSTPRRPLSQRLPQPGTPGQEGGQPGGDGSPRQPRPVPQAPRPTRSGPPSPPRPAGGAPAPGPHSRARSGSSAVPLATSGPGGGPEGHRRAAPSPPGTGRRAPTGPGCCPAPPAAGRARARSVPGSPARWAIPSRQDQPVSTLGPATRCLPAPRSPAGPGDRRQDAPVVVGARCGGPSWSWRSCWSWWPAASGCWWTTSAAGSTGSTPSPGPRAPRVRPGSLWVPTHVTPP